MGLVACAVVLLTLETRPSRRHIGPHIRTVVPSCCGRQPRRDIVAQLWWGTGVRRSGRAQQASLAVRHCRTACPSARQALGEIRQAPGAGAQALESLNWAVE